jgi:hypothetical protein
MLPDSASGKQGSSKSSVREDQSLRSILVTREVMRLSLRVDGNALKKPEEVYMRENEWNRTEVRGGSWRVGG